MSNEVQTETAVEETRDAQPCGRPSCACGPNCRCGEACVCTPAANCAEA